MALKKGCKAPAFTLPDKDENRVALKDFAGKWVALYFYPKDNTPGCTTEGIEFTAAQKDFEKLGAVIVGVSPDSPKSHCNFTEKHKLGVTLLSDPDKKMLDKYEAWRLKKNYGREYMGVVRSTVLIDPNGKVAETWNNVKVKGHVEAVLKRLEELRQK